MAVGKVEEGVMALHGKVDDLKGVTVKRLNDHTDRVRSLEMTRARQRGAYALMAALGSVAAWFGFRG